MSAPPCKPLLELKLLSMSFGGLKVIDELDLVVNEREIVSVIGPNGAGKTTLFNLITGIYRPDGGEILLVASLKGWWRTIALAPTLYLTAVVWENVLTDSPAVTALILFGVMLIVLMAVRPEGLLGTARVEIV